MGEPTNAELADALELRAQDHANDRASLHASFYDGHDLLLAASRLREAEGVDDMVAALKEEMNLLRARTPRPFIMTRAAEWTRMFREAIGYLHACRREHHGTDREGRRHLVNALESALAEMGETEKDRQARQIREIHLDDDARRTAPPRDEKEQG